MTGKKNHHRWGRFDNRIKTNFTAIVSVFTTKNKVKHSAISIRTFIGAKDFTESRIFYQELGFKEVSISEKLSFFAVGQLGFYLQDFYVKDWVENSMIFLEVDDVHRYQRELRQLGLSEKYESVRITDIQENDWGREFFMHDPSGVLWHIGLFY